MSLRSARNWIALEIGVALVLLLAAGSARAGTLPFTGTLTLQLGTLPALSGVGAGLALVSADGNLHLLSVSLPGGTFGPLSTSIPETAQAGLQSVRFTGLQNLSGGFANLSGGPPEAALCPCRVWPASVSASIRSARSCSFRSPSRRRELRRRASR